VVVWGLRQYTIKDLGNLIFRSIYDCRGISSVVNKNRAVSVSTNSLDLAHVKQIAAHVTDCAGLT